MFSNLDDRYENGVHVLMKFIKFGYGRCSDHASKDIRDGILNNKSLLKELKKFDWKLIELTNFINKVTEKIKENSKKPNMILKI
jgi:hypothetical protein